MKGSIKSMIRESADVKLRMLDDEVLLDKVAKVVDALVTSFSNGGKVLIFGNGGSAADAQHLAGEFVGRFYRERKALPALALHSNTSVLTAVANDYSYDRVFARQVEAHAARGDVAWGISTSGNSPNVVEAIKVAKDLGAFTLAMTGQKGSKLSQLADECIRVPSNDTPRVQEAHITLGHVICQLVEERLFDAQG
ncbi:MAG: D-sedoheptulose 7-phosphate isomerase [Promethearchaeota archaeon]